jgi:hypothetical protein
MNNLTSTIDQLGVLNAEIAKLEAAADALKAILVEVGPGKYQGERYAVTVTEPSTRDVLDMKAVRAHLSTQFITAHTTKTPVKPSVRVSVRKDVAVAA